MSHREPSAAALAVMRAWPSDDWITEADLATALLAAGVGTGSRSLSSVLGEARRRSWLRRRTDAEDTTLFSRTRTGKLLSLAGALSDLA